MITTFTHRKPITVSVLSLLTGSLLLISSAHAGPQVIVTPAVTGSTVVEQTFDGQIATITTTPTGISMQNGMPYYATQVTNVPRYMVRQNQVASTGTAVTAVPVNTLPLNTIPITNQVTSVGVVSTPVSTVTQASLPVTAPSVAVVTNNTPVVMTNSLDTLQLAPVFSTPNVVTANTKVMKILKNKEGVEFAVPANHIAPGDIIEYHTVYTNTSAKPINNINATVSLPNGVKLISVNSPLPTLATLGGNTYQSIGQTDTPITIQQPYSSLRWNLVDLDANTTQTVVLRATVQ